MVASRSARPRDNPGLPVRDPGRFDQFGSSELTGVLPSWKAAAMEKVAPLVAAVAIVTSLLSGAVADARGPRLFNLRMEGYVGPPQQGRRERADLQLRVGRTDVRFQVTRATVISGDVSAGSIFSRVRPFRPNFNLRGQPTLVGRIEDAAPGARLRIVGTGRPGSRDFMVSSVETLPSGDQPAEPQPPPPPVPR
jgi:hypothetical protein